MFGPVDAIRFDIRYLLNERLMLEAWLRAVYELLITCVKTDSNSVFTQVIMT